MWTPAQLVRDIADPNKDAVPFLGNPFNNKSNSGSTNSGAYDGALYYDDASKMLQQYYNGAWNDIASANKGQDPNSANTGGTVSTSSKPTVDQATINAINRSINTANDSINRIGGQKATALSNLLGAYNQQRATLDNQRADTEQDYTRDRSGTLSNYSRTKERIGENVRQNVNSLQSLLGARGAGSSSAAQIMAPYAAARAGTSEQNEAADTVAQNLQSLDTNWNRFKRDWDTSSNNLETTKTNQQRETESGFAGKEAELRNNLATLQQQLAQARGGGRVDTGAIDAQISRLLDSIDSLAKREYGTVIKANTPGYTAPELSDYDVETRGVASQQSQDPTYDETQAFYPVREDEEDKFLQSLYS